MNLTELKPYEKDKAVLGELEKARWPERTWRQDDI